MSETAKHDDIEDVLSSIRRLVADNAPPPPADEDLGPERLVLTPALRVADPEDPFGQVQPTVDEEQDVEAEIDSWSADSADEQDGSEADSESGEMDDASEDDWGEAEHAPEDDEADLAEAEEASSDTEEANEAAPEDEERVEFGLNSYLDHAPQPENVSVMTFPRDQIDAEETEADATPEDAETGSDDDGPQAEGWDEPAAEAQDDNPEEDAEEGWPENEAEPDVTEEPAAQDDDATDASEDGPAFSQISDLEFPSEPNFEPDQGDTDWAETEAVQPALEIAAARQARGEEPTEPEIEDLTPVFSRSIRRVTLMPAMGAENDEDQPEAIEGATAGDMADAVSQAIADEEEHRHDVAFEEAETSGSIADETFDADEDEPSDLAQLDEEALRDLIAQVVREELQGALGQRITRNVRKMVRREIRLALAADDFE